MCDEYNIMFHIITEVLLYISVNLQQSAVLTPGDDTSRHKNYYCYY